MVEPGDADTRWMMMGNRVISEPTSYPCVPMFFANSLQKYVFIHIYCFKASMTFDLNDSGIEEREFILDCPHSSMLTHK